MGVPRSFPWLAALALAGACRSDTGIGDKGGDEGAEPPAPTPEPETTEAPAPPDDPWDTAAPVDSGAPEPADSGAPEPEPETVVCGLPTDPAALADCAAGGFAALVSGAGYASVDAAVRGSAPGATIVVCPGTWTASLDLRGGRELVAADPTPGATALDGGGTRRVVDSQGGRIAGLTLQNGQAQGGGCVSGAGDLVLECVTVQNCDAGRANGGGVDWDGALTVATSTFLANSAGYAGGGLAVTGRLDVTDSTFERNTAGYEGGAVSADGATVIAGSTFTGNEANYDGGAVCWGGWDDGRLEVRDSAFTDNTGRYSGGALQIGTWARDEVLLERVDFSGNRGRSGGAAVDLGSWGAIDFTAVDCTFADHTVGEAALLAGGWLEDGGTVVLEGTSFTDNACGSAGAFGSSSNSGPLAFRGADLVVWRNDGGAGAVSLDGDETFDCVDCDFGAGADDNTPRDAVLGGTPHPSLPLDFSL